MPTKQHISERIDWLIGPGVACVTFAVYLATMPPSLTFRHWGVDGGDLIAAARTLGVPHPPGFPTYTLLAWLATHLPAGSVAHRVSLLSAVCAAGAASHVVMCVQSILADTRGRVPAVVAGLALGLSPLVWSQAIIAEVYTTALCFTSLSLLLTLRWRCGGHDALLWAASLLFGLGLGVHLTLGFMALPAMVMAWPLRRRLLRPPTLAPAVALFALGLATFAYLPLAASHQPPVNWGAPDSWARFTWLVTGRYYGAMVFALPASGVVARLGAWSEVLVSQFACIGWAFAAMGLVQLWKRDRSFASAGILWISSVASFAFFYNSDDSHVFLLPAMVVPATWLGVGAYHLAEWARLRSPRLRPAIAALLLLPVASLALNWQAMDLSRDEAAGDYVTSILGAIAPRGLAIVRSDRPTFALWYSVYAEGRRQDVAVVNITLLGFAWYREQLRAIYPQLRIPEPKSPATSDNELARDLVLLNYLDYPIYALDPSDEWKLWFDINQETTALAWRVLVRSRWERAQ